MAAPAERPAGAGETIWTIGHSTRPWEDFVALLRREGIRTLVDVRSLPGSRRHPQYDQEQMARALPEAGIAYVHAPALGGRRRARRGAPPTAWRNAGFAGYADYMTTPEFHAALDELIRRGAGSPTAVMCAEAVPWRCHRSMIADALIARGVRVVDILDAGPAEHRLTRFAVVRDGEVRYPPEEPPQAELGLDRG